MKIGNDIHGNINGSIVNIDEVEIDLVVNALKDSYDHFESEMIDKLISQFEAMLRGMMEESSYTNNQWGE